MFHNDGTLGTFSGSYSGDIICTAEGDLNADGFSDIAVGGNGWLGIYLMTPDPVNTMILDLNLNNDSVNCMTFNDINWDNIPDFLFHTQNERQIYFMFGNKRNQFAPTPVISQYVAYENKEFTAFRLKAGNMDKDKKSEIVTLNRNDEDTKTILVIKKLGSITYDPQLKDYKALIEGSDCEWAVGDLDNDRINEYVITSLKEGKPQLVIIKKKKK